MYCILPKIELNSKMKTLGMKFSRKYFIYFVLFYSILLKHYCHKSKFNIIKLFLLRHPKSKQLKATFYISVTPYIQYKYTTVKYYSEREWNVFFLGMRQENAQALRLTHSSSAVVETELLIIITTINKLQWCLSRQLRNNK